MAACVHCDCLKGRTGSAFVQLNGLPESEGRLFRTDGIRSRSQAQPRSARPGFSLIELLVVFGVTLLLVGLLLPVLGAARSQVRTVRGLTNLNQIGRALFAYAEAHDQNFPIGYLDNESGEDTNWTTLLNGLMLETGMTDASLEAGGFLEIFADPNARLSGGCVHYSGHPVLLSDVSKDRPIQAPCRVTRIVRASQMLLVMDGAQDPFNDANAHATAWRLDGGSLWSGWAFDGADAQNTQLIDPGLDQDTFEGAGDIRWRQAGGGANFLYCDGHAETGRPSQISKANVRVD